MSVNIEKNQLIPVVESKVFIDHPDARFAIGEVAVNGAIVNSYENEFFGAARLRADTYLSKGFVRCDELDDDGTELDQNDTRSAHFVMLEQGAKDSLARVVGNMRLIIKSSENSGPLPLENYRPDVFSDNPLPIQSVEVSRLIARHEDLRLQSQIMWPLLIAGQKYGEHNHLGPAYGLLTPALTRRLRMQRIPVTAVADEKYIEAINASKQPVSINLPLLKRLIRATGDQGIDVSEGGFSYLNLNTDIEEDL
jgi:N-acyl-L-homoserine lactone synthetase